MSIASMLRGDTLPRETSLDFVPLDPQAVRLACLKLAVKIAAAGDPFADRPQTSHAIRLAASFADFVLGDARD